jgi:hypothetical protein
MVPRIMNRDLTGVCPVERAAAGLESPAAVIAAARRTLVSLHGGGKGVVA